MKKLYKNNDTGEIFTLEEIKTLCDQFYYEAGHETAKDYFEYMLDNGMIEEIETREIVIENYPANIIVWIDNDCIDINIDQWQEFTLEENTSAAIDEINNSLDIAFNETETNYITEKLNVIFGN